MHVVELLVSVLFLLEVTTLPIEAKILTGQFFAWLFFLASNTNLFKLYKYAKPVILRLAT